MFLSLEGLLIGLAVVAGAFVVGVTVAALRPRPHKRPATIPIIRRRYESGVGSAR